jgi:LmbE family N-acetylglucosaminyl deacetylase
MAVIIAFGVQPHQVESGMGGTILKLTESAHQVMIIDLTNGKSLNNHPSEYLKKEAIKSSRILGIDERITLDYQYFELENNQEIRAEIAEIYHNISPDIMFLPYPAEENPEIKIVTEICHASLANLQQYNLAFLKTKTFYYFATPVNYYQKPSFIMDISKEIEMKVEALKSYESQFGKNIQNSQLFENILNLNRYYGMLIGKKFGESFISKEPLEMKNIEFAL